MRKQIEKRYSLHRLALASAAIFLGACNAVSAQTAQPNVLNRLCSDLDLRAVQWLDDAPVAEHIPAAVLVAASEHHILARFHCRTGNAAKAVAHFEVTLTLLGEPWFTRRTMANLSHPR